MSVAKWSVVLTQKEEISKLDSSRIIDACWIIEEETKKKIQELLEAELGKGLVDRIKVSFEKSDA